MSLPSVLMFLTLHRRCNVGTVGTSQQPAPLLLPVLAASLPRSQWGRLARVPSLWLPAPWLFVRGKLFAGSRCCGRRMFQGSGCVESVPPSASVLPACNSSSPCPPGGWGGADWADHLFALSVVGLGAEAPRFSFHRPPEVLAYGLFATRPQRPADGRCSLHTSRSGCVRESKQGA